MSAFDFVPSPRRYVGYETLNDGYDRIRIRTRIKYETVNDDSGHVESCDEHAAHDQSVG